MIDTSHDKNNMIKYICGRFDFVCIRSFLMRFWHIWCFSLYKFIIWVPAFQYLNRHSNNSTRVCVHIYIYTYIYTYISYPLFADADTGIYPHAASQYHARPKAKCGIAMLSVDKFPYPRKQTRGNEFIPCSNNICDILKRFRSFKIPAITLIWPKSSYKHSVTRSYRSGKESGRRSEAPLWCHQWRSFISLSLTLMTSNVRYGSIFHGC